MAAAEVLAKIAAAPVPTAAEILRIRKLIAGSKRAGGDLRGNSVDRARRTQRLLNDLGDGTTVSCAYCPRQLTAATLTQDKIYPGSLGGRYIYANLLPACLGCNQRRSDHEVSEFLAAAGALLS